MASEEESIGRDDLAVLGYVLSWQFQKAVIFGMGVLNNGVRTAFTLSPNSKRIRDALKYVRATTLDVDSRMSFLCVMLWFGAHQAAELGHWSTACVQLKMLCDKLYQDHFPNAFLTQREVNIQYILFIVASCDREAVREAMERQITSDMQGMLQYLLELLNGKLFSSSSSSSSGGEVQWGSDSAQIFEEVQRLQESLNLPVLPNSVLEAMRCSPVEVGSKLPMIRDLSNNHVDILDSAHGGGRHLVLEDETSVMSFNDAILWAQTNPFSPTGSGFFLNLKFL